MRKVKNRKAIRRVADRTRKAAKSRNLIAVLAIALTALLFILRKGACRRLRMRLSPATWF